MTRKFGYLLPTPVAQVARLPGIRAKMKSGAVLSERERQLVDSILYALETGGDPRVTIGLKRRRGTPRSGRAWWLALDYACRKELLGKAAAAAPATSKTWNVSMDTVEDAYTDWRLGVEREYLDAARTRDVPEYGKAEVFGALLELAAQQIGEQPVRRRKKSTP